MSFEGKIFIGEVAHKDSEPGARFGQFNPVLGQVAGVGGASEHEADLKQAVPRIKLAENRQATQQEQEEQAILHGKIGLG